MAVFVHTGLPAVDKLKNEGIDIRTFNDNSDVIDGCLNILIFNLMPTKQVTETQLIRMLASSDKNISVYLMNTETYVSRNTDSAYIDSFYNTISFYKNRFFDGLIITGAPIEHLEFSQIMFWNEFCGILDWAKTNVKSVYSICWAAQGVLNYYCKIKKYPLDEKMFGIFTHKILQPDNPLCKNIPETFIVPHSRHAEVLRKDIEDTPNLDLLAVSDEAGVLWVSSEDFKIVCMTGHPEYDAETLSLEYFRDLEKGDKINCPRHYFPSDNPAMPPVLTWRETAKKIYSNWVDVISEL